MAYVFKAVDVRLRYVDLVHQAFSIRQRGCFYEPAEVVFICPLILLDVPKSMVFKCFQVKLFIVDFLKVIDNFLDPITIILIFSAPDKRSLPFYISFSSPQVELGVRCTAHIRRAWPVRTSLYLGFILGQLKCTIKFRHICPGQN